jgi:hypothetical protein
MRLIALPGVALLIVLLICPWSSSTAGDFNASLLGGYNGGGGLRGTLQASNFAQGFPLALEAGIGYSWREPGNPEAARKIFINDNTDGTPEESGWMWDFRLDFLYKVNILGLRDARLFAGVRYSMFTADFKYVGGNEDFEVSSNQWGIGVGARTTFPIGQKVGFTILAGVDNFFASTLEGHDTAYSPDGTAVNGREGYSYSDADAAIHQPKFQPVFMIGLTYGL